MQLPDISLSGTDLLEEFKHLMAEKICLAERLEDCERIIAARDKEIDLLHQMVTEANELRSSLENQLTELKLLRERMEEMKILMTVTSRQ